MTLNLDNLSVDANGRTSFSGLSSGIDFRGAVDAMIAAKRIPIDSLETKVTENADKITALQELRTSLNGMRDSLSTLYGAVSYQNTKDIFENKQAFASTSRVDGATAPPAANLIGVSVNNQAQLGSHTIDVIQTAAGHKISSQAFGNIADTLTGITAGDVFTLEGVSITLSGTESLIDLRNRINNANTGTNATGVTASIVSVSTSENYLILTRAGGDASMALTETTGTPLKDLGFWDAGGLVANELQAAQMAQFYADGLLDQTDTIYETSYQTLGAQIGSAGEITFSGGGAIAYAATDTLAILAANITAGAVGVTATVVTDGAGERLEITSATAFTMTETLAGTALTDLGINNKRLLSEQATNTITETFTGVTLSLFQASAGTTIKFDIERDLSAVKTQIVSFVDAYNETRHIINSHRALNSQTGEVSDEAGVLFGSNALKEVDQTLSRILGQGVTGVNDAFRVFSQIGINFANNNALADDLDRDTLVIDETTLDSKLLSNTDDIRRLFAFDFTTSDPRVSLLGFNADTTYSSTGYTLNIQPSSGDNMLLYSEQADNAYWNTTGGAGATIVADTALTTAPDGSQTADGFVSSAVSGPHFIRNGTTFTVTAGQSYTYSTYLKAGDKTEAQIVLALPGMKSAVSADFDLTGAGSVVATGALTDETTISSVGDGWYRVSVKATAALSGGGTVETYSKSGGNVSFIGDGLVSSPDLFLWGTQLEPSAASVTVQITDATIAPLRGTIVLDDNLAPDGNMTADSFYASIDNNTHFVSSGGLSVTAGQTYTVTSYVKPGDKPEARLELYGATGVPASSVASFDLTGAGSVTSTGAGADSASIEFDASNGWYKISVTTTATADDAFVTAFLNPLDVGATAGYVGDGPGGLPDIQYWGMSLRPQTTSTPPTSYVATTTAAASGVLATANIDGAIDGLDDGSASTSGNSINVLTGGSKGLQLFFDGFSLDASVQLDFTVGAGASLFTRLGELLDTQEGVVENEMDTLTTQNTLNEERISEMLVRLEIKRADLLERFIRMETALATANRILDSIKQTTKAMQSDN